VAILPRVATTRSTRVNALIVQRISSGKVKLAVEPKAELEQPCGEGEQDSSEVKTDTDSRDGKEKYVLHSRRSA
jgi:hypothetical protein